MPSRNGDRARKNRKNYRRLKHREAIMAFKKTEAGQLLVLGIAAERAKAASAAVPASPAA